MREFTGRTALVTGAAGGIGRALALAAAARGMRVLVCDVDPESTVAVAAECVAEGAPAALARAFDVRDASTFETRVAEVTAEWGGVDLLFCNAGVLVPRRLWEQTAREFDWLLDVNVKGVVNGIRACVPGMLARGRDAGRESHVVITGSMGGLIASPMLGAYSASKAALAVIAETLYLDLAATQAPVGVSLLAPGAVRSRIFEAERHCEAGAEPLAGPGAAMREAMIAGTARVGMDPQRVAAVTFEAIESERFWVFPHPEMLAALPARQAAMLQGRNPQFDFGRDFRPPGGR
ncbi:MAG: SDR family NAD(P)-dependent oxidoreductase, partial [Gammaproteobacteria bacterium]|nr:SDR family NAD(P)-dependent oxidoreductase [Gammaproteobacteria bacterium]